MTVTHQVWIKNHDGERVKLLTQGKNTPWRALYFTHIKNAPGLIRLELDGDSDTALLMQPDYQIIVRRRDLSVGLDWYTEWEGLAITLQWETHANGDTVLVVYGASNLDLIRRRGIWYYAGTGYTSKTGSGETVIKSFVSQNAGPTATTPPRVLQSGVTQGLSIETDLGRGGVWTGERSWRPLLDVIKEIAAATGVAYDIIGTGPGEFEFRVYEGQRGEDRTNNNLDPATGLNPSGNAPVIFSLVAGNMAEPMYVESHSDEVNAVLVLGDDTGTSRNVTAVSDATAIAATPWARREATRNASQESASGRSSVGAQVIEEGAAQVSFSFKVMQLRNQAYGLHYWFGDVVTAFYKGVQADKELINVGITVTDRGEDISITFADFTAVKATDPISRQASQVAKLTSQVATIEARETTAGGGGGGGGAYFTAARAASTANIAALSGLLTIDGVTLVAGNRVLVKDQSSSVQNGLYVVAAGAWSRAADGLLAGLCTYVTEGTTQHDTIWAISTDVAITPGVTPIQFTNDLFPQYLTVAEAGALYAPFSHTHSAGAITSGQLALARGGTAADLSATGGSGQVVKQSAAGAPFTVAALVQLELPIMTGATGVAAGERGAVPKPLAGEDTKFLKGDGTWANPAAAVMTGATAGTPGTQGSVPAPAAGEQNKFLKGDATWSNVPAPATMTGATAGAAGTGGIVPIPAAGKQLDFLRGDASWQPLLKSTEIDFGATPVYAASFSIVDADVVAGRRINAALSYETATGKPADEMECDALLLVAKAAAGSITLRAEGLEGRVYGKFKINYMIG